MSLVWKTAPLGELCTVCAGGTPSRGKSEYWDGDVPWVKISDMLQGVITVTDERITRFGLENSAAKLLPPGTLLLSIFATIGRTAVLRIEAATNQAIVGLSVRDRSQLDLAFLRRFLELKAVELEGRARGVAQANINGAILKALEIPLPPLAEQRRIAEVLDRAEALRVKRRKAVAQLNTLTQSIFLDLFGDPKIPACTIGDLLESGILLLHKDGNHGSLYPRAEDFDEEGVPFLSAKAVSDDGLINSRLIENLREEKAAKLKIGWISKGDVLLAHNASVGKVALYDGRFKKALIGTSLTAFRPNPEALDSHYLAATFRSAKFQRELEKNMAQTTRNQVPITAQREFSIGLPAIALQQEFARRVTAVESLKTVQRKSLTELDALFASLQHRAFRGEL